MSETFRPVVGYEGVYEVSNMGNVRSVDRVITDALGRRRRLKGKDLIAVVNHGNRYLRVALLSPGRPQVIRYIHTLVAEAFIGPRPEGAEVAHRDGSRTNNRADNLRYATVAENQADRIAHRTSNRGGRHGMAKLTCDAVVEIRRRLANGETQQSVANAFGMSAGMIGRIHRWEAWQHPCTDCGHRWHTSWHKEAAA